MKHLEFKNDTFHKGLNYTVRLGKSWNSKLKPNDVITITDNYAIVREIFVCNFEDIPQRVYNLEHDPNCHNMIGLIYAMKRAYGQKFKNSKNPVVTCIGFEIQEKENESNLFETIIIISGLSLMSVLSFIFGFIVGSILL